MARKFKEGDRVRVKETKATKEDKLVGKVGVVTFIDLRPWHVLPYNVDLDDGSLNFFTARELEKE